MFGTVASRFNDDGVTALYQYLGRRLAGHGLPLVTGQLPMVPGRTSAQGRPSSRPIETGIWPRPRRRFRAYHGEHRRRVQPPLASGSNSTTWPNFSARTVAARPPPRSRSWPRPGGAQPSCRPPAGSCSSAWPAGVAEHRDAQLARVSPNPGPRYRRSQFLATPTTASCCAGCAPSTSPGRFPVYRGCVPVQAGGREPRPHVRRRRGPVPDQPPLSPAGRRPAGRPVALSTAFDSVTLYGFDPDVALTSTARWATLPECPSPPSGT